ncbi:MAG: hypothetical protein ACR2IE_18565 [Candidatus Sumerlaeaceae bacterium]
MARNVGIWIDYSECVISFPDEGDYIRRIMSRAGLRLRTTADAKATAAAMRDPRIRERLTKYYQEVISCVHSADAILIFGPDEASIELQKHMVEAGLGERIRSVETAPKMSTRQIVAKMVECFEDVPA